MLLLPNMWKTIINNDNPYFIKFVTSPICRLYLSDLKGLWMEQLENDETSRRFKELNPLCQTGNAVGELNGLLDAIRSDNITMEILDNTILFNAKSIVDDFEIRFKWELVKQPDDMEVTLNLINTITLLENRQQYLYYLLEKKDKEKEEYIREFGEICRDFLKTTKFKKDELEQESNNTMLNVLSNETVVSNLMEKYGDKILKRKCNFTDDRANTKKLRKYSPKFLKK